MRTKDQWAAELARLKDYFSTAELPAGEVETGFGRISSLRVYVDANLDVAEKNLGNTWFESALDRLNWVKEYIESR